jgi:hypothetical protein
MGYLDKALSTMQQQGGRVVDHDLLDATLQEIGETYRSGFIGWLKEDRSRWRRLLTLEDQINQAAPAKDERGMTAALEAYGRFFSEALSGHVQGNLFGDK